MNKTRKVILSVLFLTVFVVVASFNVGAISEKEIAVGKFYSYEDKLLSISHRGDTAFYPENSLEGVKSALEKGADFVSVNLEKTADGVYYLCEDESLGNICNAPYDNLSQMNSEEVDDYFLFDIYGKETKFRMTSLEELLEATDSEDGVILDIKPEYKDEVYDILKANDALYRVIIRVTESGKKLAEWAEGKDEKIYVIGKYKGNIIFSTISQTNSLTSCEMPAVQYESKNYFNVAFGEFFANRYLTADKTRAVAATYSLDLCGQRGDSSDGWNELIAKGYSVIETDNIEAFASYVEETDKIEKYIKQLLEKVSTVDYSAYSEVSIDNLEKAKSIAESVVSDTAVFSLNEVQDAYSKLIFALEDMKISIGEVDTRGALNVTVGKVVAAILVGAALLSGQVYVYRMRRSKKEKK